jgi:hypothetical protein
MTSHALRMISGRGGDNAPRLLFLRQQQNAIQRAALLERAG